MAKRQIEFAWDEARPEEGKCVLWCDAKHIEHIRDTEGIAVMEQRHRSCYDIVFDLRYDPIEVMDEIEDIIMEGKE